MVESRDDRTVVAGGSDAGYGTMAMMPMMLIFLLLAGGGGFGNRGNEAARETQIVNDNMNSRFSSLEAMNESRFAAQANNINHIEAMESQRDLYQEMCATKSMVQQVGHENALLNKDTQYSTLLGFKDTELNQLRCCCEQKEAMAAGFNMLAQKIDHFAYQSERDRNLRLEMKVNNLEQYNSLMPVSRPSYVTQAPGQAYFPPYNAAPANYGGYGGCCA